MLLSDVACNIGCLRKVTQRIDQAHVAALCVNWLGPNCKSNKQIEIRLV